MNNISTVLNNGFCSGCGTCKVACPSRAITIQETTSGFLKAKIEQTKCTNCGLCVRTCPSCTYDNGFLEQNVNPFFGTIKKVYLGKSINKDIYDNGQSGGVVTALLSYLFMSNQINNALLTQMPNNSILRPVARFENNPENMRHYQGSVYLPCAVNENLSDLKNNPSEKIAAVGLGCHFAGINNLQNSIPGLKKSILFRIGLICGGVLNFHSIDYLIKKANKKKSDVSNILFRSKKCGGYPGNVLISLKNSSHCCLDRNYRTISKCAYTPLSCFLCYNKMNIFSDIVAGDPWNIPHNSNGETLLISRNEKGDKLIRDAEKAGFISTTEIAENHVDISQQMEKYQKTFSSIFIKHKENFKCENITSIPDKWLKNHTPPKQLNAMYEHAKYAYFTNDIVALHKNCMKMITIENRKKTRYKIYYFLRYKILFFMGKLYKIVLRK